MFWACRYRQKCTKTADLQARLAIFERNVLKYLGTFLKHFEYWAKVAKQTD